MKVWPIDQVVPELKRALETHKAAVVNAPPGSGKTTRIPLALLDMIPGDGKIVMLEPRRIAAVSAARWMAHLLGEEVGSTVGYSIRFDSRISPGTRIEVVTEGILTRRIQNDPGLGGVSLVIFDEFHERSIHADLALALCLDIRRGLREDLRLLVMSATLDHLPVASLLGDVPVITSDGRQYPVEEHYLDRAGERPLPLRVAEGVRTAFREKPGDILVFLPGAAEIRACARELSDLTLGGNLCTLHPLYGDLPFEEQERALLPSDGRKIVLATNIAETSLTIEGVSVVVDSGLARSLRYDPATGMNRLVTVRTSLASAEQRKGRAGRLGPGFCCRLYGRSALRSMVDSAPPEILVSDLSSLVLTLAVWGVKDPSVLSWLDPPPPAAWQVARDLLVSLQALDDSGSVTEAGRAMELLPIQARLGRMIIRAAELGVTGLGADLAAVLSERDVIKKPDPRWSGKREADIAIRLDVLRKWRRTGSIPREADRRAVQNSDRIAGQLMRLMPEARKGKDEDSDDEMIGRLLLSAFPDRIGRCRDEKDGRFLLSVGRSLRLLSQTGLERSTFIVAVNADLGSKGEGTIYMGSAVSEDTIRDECAGLIETERRVVWDERQGRVAAAVEERIGAILLSSKPFSPPVDETIPVLLSVLRSSPHLLVFGKEARQFQHRVLLMKRTFQGEDWPDFSPGRLASQPEEWLGPFLGGIRTTGDLSGLDVLPALRALLSGDRLRLLEKRAPLFLAAPSGRRVNLDYCAGEFPVLAVKLQEMFGLRDTPVIAEGRVRVLLHLLSPAGRPVQITRDLKGFWDNGYQLVRKELRGRYPKHPWPDDPWSAVPTKGARRKRE